MQKLLTIIKKSFWRKLINFSEFSFSAFFLRVLVCFAKFLFCIVFCFDFYIIDSIYAESQSTCLFNPKTSFLAKPSFSSNNLKLNSHLDIDNKRRITGSSKISVDLVYDKNFLEKYGASVADIKIANLVKAANQIFKRNLGLEIHVNNYGYSDSFDYTDNIPKIYNALFREKKTKSGSILHLFSGRDFGNLHGAAYGIGTVCRGSEKSFSFSSSNPRSSLLNVFMHEILHNLGATHIISYPKSIMSPDLNSESTNFMHNDTKAELALFLKAFGSCVGLENAINTYIFAPSSLTLDVSRRRIGIRRRKRITFDITIKLNKLPLPLKVNLLYKRRKRAHNFRVLKTKEANNFGRVTMRARRAGIYKIGIYNFVIENQARKFRFRKGFRRRKR